MKRRREKKRKVNRKKKKEDGEEEEEELGKEEVGEEEEEKKYIYVYPIKENGASYCKNHKNAKINRSNINLTFTQPGRPP